MKKISFAASAVVICAFLFAPWIKASDSAALAEKALAAGDKVGAIEYYFAAVSDSKLKSTGKAAIMGKLGKLLNDTERYEEAEQVLSELVEKHGAQASPESYEELLQIYVNFRPDAAKASKLRDAYARRFGRTPALRKIDTTLKVMGTDYSAGAEVLKLPVKDIAINSYASAPDFDREFYPVRNYVAKKAVSPDKKREVVRVKVNGRSSLYVKSSDGRENKRIPSSAGGFGAQWSWNGKKILFSSVNSAGERSIKIYDTVRNVTKTIFSGNGMETLACISPDAEKVFFVYRRAPWIMSADGSVITLLHKDIRIKEPLMAAWSKDGGSILTVTGSENNYTFTVYQLGNKTARLPGKIEGGRAIIR